MANRHAGRENLTQPMTTRFQKVDALYKAHIDYTRHENELMHQRTTWFLAIQTVLLAGFGYLVLNYFESTSLAIQGRPDEGFGKIAEFLIEWLFIAIFGLASTASARRSIRAAGKAQAAIVKNWDRVKARYARSEPALDYYPELMGGGDDSASKDGGRLAADITKATGIFWIAASLILALTSATVFTRYYIDPAAFAQAEKKSAEREDSLYKALTTTAPAGP